MHNKEITKKKNDLFHSIMSNPKLAKTLSEALSAPIGSTKRKQAKSVLSIMNKLSGIKTDGQGGPGMMMPGAPSAAPSAPTPTKQNYGNMMIFPAAPKFKTKEAPVTPPSPETPTAPSMDGQGGMFDGVPSFDASSFSLPTGPGQYTGGNPFTGSGAANTQPTSPSSGSYFNQPATDFSKLNLPGGQTQTSPFSGMQLPPPAQEYITDPLTMKRTKNPLYSNISSQFPSLSGKTPTGGTQQPTGTTQPTGGAPVNQPQAYTSEDIKAMQAELVKNGYMTQAEVNTGPGIMGPKTKAAIAALQAGQPGKYAGGTQPGTGTPGGTSSAITSSVPGLASAVKSGLGATAYAMDFANAKFGGGLDQYIATLDSKLKKDFNLEPLENELSNIKAMKGNLVPTLQNYVKGKDQYLRFVDEMIRNEEGNLLKTDMSNPAVADSYNTHLNYLYTLKGRQEQRYGNFLNSAIADYNADVEKAQSNYESAYNDYTEAMTRQGTMAQNEYNNLYTRMASVYTELENAPIKAENLRTLKLQNDASAKALLDNGISSSNTSDPEFLKAIAGVITAYGDKDKGFNDTILGAEGLWGVYKSNNLGGTGPMATTEALKRMMAQSLSTGDTKVVAKYKKLITDLGSINDPAAQSAASALGTQLGTSFAAPIETSVKAKLPQLESAIKQLISGTQPWFGRNRQSGLQDKATWMKDHASLGTETLDALFNSVSSVMGQYSKYKDAPTQYQEVLLSGTPEEKIKKITDLLATSS